METASTFPPKPRVRAHFLKGHCPRANGPALPPDSYLLGAAIAEGPEMKLPHTLPFNYMVV